MAKNNNLKKIVNYITEQLYSVTSNSMHQTANYRILAGENCMHCLSGHYALLWASVLNNSPGVLAM